MQAALAVAMVPTVSEALGGGYVGAVRANMLQGGDNASRAVLLGALLAAQVGLVFGGAGFLMIMLDCLVAVRRISRYVH